MYTIILIKIITTIIVTYRTLLFDRLFFNKIKHRMIITIRIVILAITPRMIQIESGVPASASVTMYVCIP